MSSIYILAESQLLRPVCHTLFTYNSVGSRQFSMRLRHLQHPFLLDKYSFAVHIMSHSVSLHPIKPSKGLTVVVFKTVQ